MPLPPHCLYSIISSCSQCPFSHWWWVPIIAPMIGAAIAVPVYWFMIEVNHPDEEKEEEERKEEEE